MLNLATSENIESICSDDPVRPNIPYIWRIEPPNKFTYYLTSRFIFEPPVSEKSKKAFTTKLRTEIDAVCCVSLLDDIPTTEEELMNSKEGKNAIFYTVWSKNTVRKGRGKEVLNSTINAISELPVTRYVTLSPKTEMAVQFHLKNGAVLLSENKLTLNFEYKS